MKTLGSALLLGLAVLAAGQESVRLQRNLVVGQSSIYKLHFSGPAQFADLDVTQTTSQKVTSIAQDGSAEVQYTILSRKVLVNGSDFSTKPDPPFKHRVDKSGIPLDGDKKDFDRNDFSRYLEGLFDRDLKVGDTVPIERSMPDGKQKATGSLKLLKLSGDEAAFDAKISVPRGIQAPTVLRGQVRLNTKDGTLVEIEATVENLDLGRAVLERAKYSYGRVPD
jgi:hypothetical protein